ncbi:hypothetical protein FNV43_RR15097 [Rhamnella rubrinervis]|uniref:RRM domain-containing protein n=1 Tax=Rhamnella rubrinervis TaxID=2594499 RepID=A0A8K0E177_9ROSA|nr:hypothetical protein FNV43_RR15097 [Rhamnella rubrinervis]
MKPIFCGNLDFESRQSDIERLFRRYGKVDRVDIKSGFAFVYMEDERDAEYAIRRLDRTEFGRKGRQLRVEWTKDKKEFCICSVRITGGCYQSIDSTNMSKFLDRVISVEYAVRDDDDRRNGYSPDRRGRDMSPDKRSHDRGRSPSPYRRDRGSPDYGRGSNLSSRPDPRASPNYSRDASPVSDGYQSRSPTAGKISVLRRSSRKFHNFHYSNW